MTNGTQLVHFIDPADGHQNSHMYFVVDFEG